MDGIHDLGGMSGFGAVEIEPNEPVFHEQWEFLAIALNFIGLEVLRAYNVDEYRHSVERMDPAHYLTARYYERMLTGVTSLLVEKGVVTSEELEERAAGAYPLAQPNASVEADGRDASTTPRFAVGDRVHVREIHPVGHTRVPRYVRGASGEVLHVAPLCQFPDASAHGLPGREEANYHVLFRAQDLWADAAGTNDTFVVDLWETYLEPASGMETP